MIRSMYGRSEIDIRFPTPIPVHITYQTAFVDEHGKLVSLKAYWDFAKVAGELEAALRPR